VPEEIDVHSLTGLTGAEAAARLTVEGPNELPSSRERTIFRIAWEVVREPMFLLLVACGSIYLVLGDVREALMLLGFVFIVMGITIYQERKTERALEALRDLSSPRALVIRDGRRRRIAGREVVRGDLLVLHEGDRVPADATLMTGINLSADESLLTGESVPVRKMPEEIDTVVARPGGDDLPYVYSGTMIVQGQGIATVHAIGEATELGKIGKALGETGTEQTRLQKATAGLVRRIAVFGAALFVVVVVVYGLTRGNWLQGLLAGIAMAMAMLPEEFPVVLTVFLALGAWRIAQKRVLTRRIPAVETLGAATVLCVDKTGTLTQNRMSVSRLFAHGRFWDVDPNRAAALPEEFHELIEYGILASKSDPFDPMEKALRNLGVRSLGETEHLHDDWTLVHEYPLSRQLLALSHVWSSPDGSAYAIAAKGAPEAVVDLCHLDEPTTERITRAVREMATSGLRVIGIAQASFAREDLPDVQHEFQFKFLGLVGLSDPVRPTVPAAVQECQSAGIRIVMITGDYPETARSIARDIGLKPIDAVITGPELDRMDDAELRRQVARVSIFARAVPEQKLRLVRALKANGEVVAMTGDGVNDAPALKAADIGIAMGERGTDVAREASSLVLLDDDFASIVAAARLGRRIYDNLKKAMAYIFAIHVPIAGMSLIPVLLRWPLVLMPVHIVFLELIIDPACSVVFEAEKEERGVMRRPPRDPKEPIFGRRMIMLSLLQGTAVLAVVFAVYAIALYRGQGEAEARALTFTTLIISNLALILTNRSWSRTVISLTRVTNAALYWVVGGAVGFLALVLRVPALRDLFHFAPLHAIDLAICVAGGFISILWFEGAKMIRTRKDTARSAI
jgi:Ca2+-transporting ATPase